jgi:hypothetical protein
VFVGLTLREVNKPIGVAAFPYFDTLPSERQSFFSFNQELVCRLEAVTDTLQAMRGAPLPASISRLLGAILSTGGTCGLSLLGPLHEDVLVARQLFVDNGCNHSPISPG